MKEAGLRIKELTFEEKKNWAAQLPNIPKERYEEMKKLGQPGEAIYHYIKLLKEAGHQFPRDWEAER